MWDYSDKVKDHFLHPRNVGEIENPDAVAEVGNITCGDALKLTLRIDKATQRILDARFQTFGCASAIASSSAVTEMVKGLTLDQAAKLSNDDIAEFLQGLPEAKMHCSVMGMEALEKAIAAYRHQTLAVAEGTIVCRCFGVTDQLIEKVVREHGLTTIEQVTHYCKAGGGCGGCHKEIQKIIDRVCARPEAGKSVAAPPAPKRPLTNLERVKRIEEVVEREIRPWLRNDGGDIEIIDIDRAKVTVALRGTCSNCRVSQFTLKSVVEQKLRELVDETIHVEQVE